MEEVEKDLNLYFIRLKVDYGEFVHIVAAKDRREVKKIMQNHLEDYWDNEGKITEIKLLKAGKRARHIIRGGSQE